jgi:hypothetical protein
VDTNFRITFPVSAPEVIFEALDSLGPGIDVWAFACTSHNIGDGLLFHSRLGTSGDKDTFLFQWVWTLGKLPDDWWERRNEEFEDGQAWS